MNPQTRAALEDSIKHWEENVEAAKHGRPVDISGKSCALCERFFVLEATYPCLGCPIHIHTNKNCCRDTPYWKVAELVEEDEGQCDISSDLITACEEELAFLISLRPEEE